MKNLLMAFILLSVSQLASAEIVEVYQWEPYPGRAADLLTTMQEAAQIHTSLGATIQINVLDIGSTQNIDYVMRYDDLISWGESRDKNLMSAEWTAFFARVSANPAGKLVSSVQGINTDTTTMADDFADQPIFNVSVFDPDPGGSAILAEGFSTAKMMHEAMGARVETYTELYGGTDKMHYVMFFDSWAHMAQVTEAMSTNEAWQAFNSATLSNPNPGSALVERFSGRVVANF